MLWMPRSMHVRLPISRISSSIFFVTLATTSSMRAGWMRPSVTNWCRDSLAISRRTGSKQLRIIASGVSSTMNSTPVDASRARMFRPSRPMIRPLMSSLEMLKTETEFSTLCSVATRWMVWITIFFASWLAFCFASSMMSWTWVAAMALASVSNCSFRASRASSADMLLIFSSNSTARWRSLSKSLPLFSRASKRCWTFSCSLSE